MTMRVLLLIVFTGTVLPAGEIIPVTVPGSEVTYVPKVQQTAHGQDVTLSITGTALRKKFFVNIYSLASYVQEGVAVGTAEELATVDAVKLLHLVMERQATGPDFLKAFKDAVGSEKAKKDFAEQFKTLETTLKDASVDQGEYVLLTYIPNAGTRFRVADRVDVTIPGKEFGTALWGTFLGPKPVDAEMKKGLTSRWGK